MTRKIEAPNESERLWIADNVARACALARKYGGDPETTTVPSMAALDALWVAMGDAIRERNGDPNALIHVVGLALGQHLADTTGLGWAVVTDEHGTDIALHGEPGEILVFPTSLVAKRWQSGEGAFLEAIAAALAADITRAQRG